MKTPLLLAASLGLAVFGCSTVRLVAQGTAFTYQGRLQHGGSAANGLYEMSFVLYDSATDGNVVGTPQTLAPVPVTNGLFTATLDFGAAAFMGANRWLEISVTVFGSDQPVVPLAPRQPLTPTPYTLHAYNAAGLMSFANAPLDIKVNGQRALRLEPTSDSPNVIGGFSGNEVLAGAVGATIAGGGLGFAGPDNYNRVSGNYGSIGGGLGNSAEAHASTIAGGNRNTVQSGVSVIGGGSGNKIGTVADFSTIAGGGDNSIENGAGNATIGGGVLNTIEAGADGSYSTIAGGIHNTIQNSADYSAIGGGRENLIGIGAYHATIGGGIGNTNLGWESVIAGGSWNVVTEHRSTIGGGALNRAGGLGATTVGGGFQNVSTGYVTTVAGGYGNIASGFYGAVGGGQGNRAENAASTVAGGDGNRAQAHYSSVGGGHGNSAFGYAAVIAGGGGRSEDGEDSVGNTASGDWSSVTGGRGNTAPGIFASVGGGGLNQATGFGAVVAGGGGVHFEDGNEPRGNTASGVWSVVSGGADNVASGVFSVVGGGEFNRASGINAVVPGGLDCLAAGINSFAAGHGAHARHDGSYVWADSSGGPHFESTTNHQFSARAAGGVRFFTDSAATTGAELPPGSGAWSSLSDRNAKENFASANTRKILDQVAALPLATWNYKAQGSGVRHLGPTAQDFHAAFSLGENDRTIATVDADGVALAAIQGLNQKLDERVKEQAAEIQELKARLAALEQVVLKLSAKGN